MCYWSLEVCRLRASPSRSMSTLVGITYIRYLQYRSGFTSMSSCHV